MNMKLEKILYWTICTGVCLLFVAAGAQAQDGIIVNDSSVDYGDLVELQAELDAATPFPTPMIEMPADGISSIPFETTAEAEAALPGYSPGWAPGSGPMPDFRVGYTIGEDHPFYAAATGEISPGVYGSPPTNPLAGPYSPYQRWTWFGRYITYPTSTVGKLYFDSTGNGVRNAYCSAAVISNRTIATAGHCMSDGASGFYGLWLFCPSYNAGGVNATQGCWGWSSGKVSARYHTNGEIDRDYGCLVLATTGTVHATTVGARTGWLGRAWNWAHQQPTVVLGYPGNDSFPAYHIIVGTSPEWYQVNMTIGDGQVTKYIGGDQHSGNSGGPWVLNWGHRNQEWAAVDSDPNTDPAQVTTNGVSHPWLNGVYSHKRCVNGCASPPTASSGMFWNEMGAAEFNNTAGDTDEAEDQFQFCFSSE